MSAPAGAAIPWAYKYVPRDSIVVDQSMQVRGGIDKATVTSIGETIAEHGATDPIDIFEIPGEEGGTTIRLLADGFHRIAAYDAAGTTKIPARIRAGARTEALQHAMRTNGHHGRQMTNAEKRHAAGLAVADPAIGIKNDSEIAKMIGCSTSLISEVRRGVKPADKAVRKQAAEKKKREASAPAPSKRETESPAPAAARSRERKPADPPKPTKAMILRYVQEHIDNEAIDEADILKLLESTNGEYREVAKAGGQVTLKVVGKNGRVQIEIPAIVREISVGTFVLKYEGDGKIGVND